MNLRGSMIYKYMFYTHDGKDARRRIMSLSPRFRLDFFAPQTPRPDLHCPPVFSVINNAKPKAKFPPDHEKCLDQKTYAFGKMNIRKISVPRWHAACPHHRGNDVMSGLLLHLPQGFGDGERGVGFVADLVDGDAGSEFGEGEGRLGAVDLEDAEVGDDGADDAGAGEG